MARRAAILTAILAFTCVASVLPSVTAASLPASSSSIVNSSARYARAHSLGESYQFDPRDGWNTVNVTNLQYKYKHKGSSQLVERRAGKQKSASKSGKESSQGNAKAVSISIPGLPAIKGLEGIGKPSDVTITWYTGQDLKNPSCWSSGGWTPTDESFVCALTERGWNNKPKCFTFLELCNGPTKCVFVRVVDSCAGCTPGSQHVDLTKAAFSTVADLNEGILDIQMRPSTPPLEWLENLWGPKQ